LTTEQEDPLLERFEKARSSITPAIRKEDPLFSEFTERFLWLFYYTGYRHVTWMIEAHPDLGKLRSLFSYHWDKDINNPPSGEVLIRAMPLTFHDVLDLPRETLTDHLKECFRDAMEELGAREHSKGTEKKIDVFKFPSPPGLRWEDVTIAFISDNDIRVEAPGLAQQYSYDEIEFEDKRTGGKSKLWFVFRALAMLEGSATKDDLTHASKAESLVSKDIQLLRKILYKLIRIKGDPFYHTKKGGDYQTRFQLRDEQYGGVLRRD